VTFLKDCLYVGFEAEGTRCGCKTLFVADLSVTYKQVRKAAKEHEVEHIYFGAGGTYNIPTSMKLIDLRKLMLQNYDVTFETNDVRVLEQLKGMRGLAGLDVIFVLSLPCVPTAIKMDYKDHTCIAYLDLHTTSFDDHFYKSDEKIEY
jgi:hypothetical protein